MGQPEQHSQNSTDITTQPEQDWQNRTGITGQAEADRPNKTARKGLPEQDRQNWTVRKGQPEKDRQNDCDDRTLRLFSVLSFRKYKFKAQYYSFVKIHINICLKYIQL
jgi:hypothetical protein